MLLKCSDYFKEAVTTNNDQQRYVYMSKACKQISQLLPFQSMWHLLLKQENLFFYMLMLQSTFGQNIKMLLELIIERFSHITQFQIQFLNACSQVFQQEQTILSDVIRNNIQNIFQESIGQLQFFIKQIPKNDTNEGHSVAENIISAYKAILGNIHDYSVTLELYSSLQGAVRKWPLIHEINPLIFHEVEEIIATRTPRYVDIQFFEEPTEPDSPTKSNSIRKENQIVVELQRWLSKMNYPIPVISKRIASSVINSQNMFKLKDNIEILLSFIFNPTKYEPANCWNKIEYQHKIPLKDIPNLKDCITLSQPAYIYHVRSIRTLQCLTDEENHTIIAKVNPNYFQIAFSYLSECFSEDQLKYCNFNHLTVLLNFYLQQEQDITIYFCLHFNIPYYFIYYINYDSTITFLINLFTQFNLLGQPLGERCQKLYNQVWSYFEAANLFQEIFNLLLNPKNRLQILEKCTPDYKNNEMINVFTLKPDFKLKEKVFQQNESNFTYVIEEKIHLKFDVDFIKHFIQKKTIKQLSFFNKVSHKVLPPTNQQVGSMVDVIMQAIQDSEIVSEPTKKKISRNSREKLIVLRSASVMFDLEEEDQVKDPFIPYAYNPNPLEIRIETKESQSKFDQRSQSRMRDSINLLKKKSRNMSFQLYPLSLKDINFGKWDKEQKLEQFQTENLIKDEQFSYNLMLFLSTIIQQYISFDHKFYEKSISLQGKQQRLGTILINDDCKPFDNLMKIYLFRIKITPFIKENSGIICGKLVNLILKQKPQYINFQDNANDYVDALCKILINSLEWKANNSTIMEMDISKILLTETLCLFIEYSINRGQINILNRISATTWSCLFEMFKQVSISKKNQVYSNLFLRLLKCVLQYGSEFNNHTLFMKLNLLGLLRQMANLTENNAVPNKQFNYLNEIIEQICKQIQNSIIKFPNRECFKTIINLDSWNLLKLQYHIRTNQHTSSFYSVDQSRMVNSTPATNMSIAKIRIRKTNNSSQSQTSKATVS